mgnify:CR=1 FL=1
MSPWHKEQLVVKAAEWMWWNQKKNEPDIWWVPSDLTDDNPDKSNPLYSLDDAQTVYEELKKRGLLRIGKVPFFRKLSDREEKHEMVVYFIQRHRERAWLSLIDSGVFRIYVGSVVRNLGGIFLSILIFLIATVAGGFLSQIGSELWDLLVPAWP